jgi:hypothetical protein
VNVKCEERKKKAECKMSYNNEHYGALQKENAYTYFFNQRTNLSQHFFKSKLSFSKTHSKTIPIFSLNSSHLALHSLHHPPAKTTPFQSSNTPVVSSTTRQPTTVTIFSATLL